VIELFLDTNILLYAVSENPAEKEKALVCETIVRTISWAWSAQVAAEFFRAGTSPKQFKPMTSQEALVWIQTWMRYPIVPVDGSLVIEAIAIAQRFGIAYFDAQILAAAKKAGCSKVYSEDLNPGQNYGGVTVINPFLSAVAS
jgi:predicted nucleic acid-binding protein